MTKEIYWDDEQTTTTLDDWIGEAVRVKFATEEENEEFEGYSCKLQSAGERGVRLRLSPDESSSYVRYFFFPWRRIKRIQGYRPADA
jgi:hypothetical protein